VGTLAKKKKSIPEGTFGAASDDDEEEWQQRPSKGLPPAYPPRGDYNHQQQYSEISSSFVESIEAYRDFDDGRRKKTKLDNFMQTNRQIEQKKLNTWFEP